MLGLFEHGVVLMAPVQQLAETRKILLEKMSLSEEWVEDQMERLGALVMPLHPAIFDKHERDAKIRLHSRGQPDWPVLAASIETGSAIWSHDKDFFGSGAPVWSTAILRKQVELVA